MPTPGKNAPGLKGFPTPDTADADGYLLFIFPSNNDWAGLLLGAAGELANPYNWYEWGSLTPDEAADAWRQIIIQAPYNLQESGIPAPYWDDAEDADDELPPDEQPWYGYVTDPEAPPDELTFIENAAIWAFTGFVAFATLEVGAYPAVVFNTLAKRWVMAFKREDLGEIIRVLVDSVEVGRVDTSTVAEGEIIRVHVVGDPDEELHTIQLVQVS